jgi:hypothetical protein
MGILPMSLTGVPPVSSQCLCCCCFAAGKNEKKKHTGKMPVGLTGETPVLRVLLEPSLLQNPVGDESFPQSGRVLCG